MDSVLQPEVETKGASLLLLAKGGETGLVVGCGLCETLVSEGRFLLSEDICEKGLTLFFPRLNPTKLKTAKDNKTIPIRI